MERCTKVCGRFEFESCVGLVYVLLHLTGCASNFALSITSIWTAKMQISDQFPPPPNVYILNTNPTWVCESENNVQVIGVIHHLFGSDYLSTNET